MISTPSRRRLRVALTTRIPIGQSGGIEASVAELVPRIVGRRPDWDVRAIHAFSKVGAFNRIPFFGDLIAALSLARKTTGFDVVLVNGGEYAWPRMLRRRDRERTIVVWHGTRAGEVPALVPRMSPAVKIYFFLEVWLQRAALLARGQIAVGDSTVSELRSAYRRLPTVHVVPNGAPKLDPSLDRSRRKNRVAWIGTNAYKKGLDIAEAACTRAREQVADLELLIVGLPRPANAPSWMTYVGRLGRDASLDCLRSAEVFLATSRYEGCSIAVMEALTLGVPVVAGPAVAWMVGEAGISVDSFDDRDYAEAVVRVIRRPEVARAMSAAGPVRAQSFDWGAASDAYVAEIERLSAD